MINGKMINGKMINGKDEKTECPVSKEVVALLALIEEMVILLKKEDYKHIE